MPTLGKLCFATSVMNISTYLVESALTIEGIDPIVFLDLLSSPQNSKPERLKTWSLYGPEITRSI